MVAFAIFGGMRGATWVQIIKRPVSCSLAAGLLQVCAWQDLALILIAF